MWWIRIQIRYVTSMCLKNIYAKATYLLTTFQDQQPLKCWKHVLKSTLDPDLCTWRKIPKDPDPLSMEVDAQHWKTRKNGLYKRGKNPERMIVLISATRKKTGANQTA